MWMASNGVGGQDSGVGGSEIPVPHITFQYNVHSLNFLKVPMIIKKTTNCLYINYISIINYKIPG